MSRPDAAIELTERDAVRIVALNFPELGASSARSLGNGWDNAAFLVPEGPTPSRPPSDARGASATGPWVFRFPRRSEAVIFLEHEVRAAPALAPLLPIAIAAPELVARSPIDYPYPFAGHRHLPGDTAERLTSDGARGALAVPLAKFLRALHSSDPQIAGAPPGDVMHKTDLARGVERIRRFAGHRSDIVRRAEELARTPAWSGPPCWLHGDLYPRHLVLRGGELAGVIDWGDVHKGDPALDLSIVVGWLPPDAQARFFDAYGEVDPDTLERARFRALAYGAYFAFIEDDPALAALGRVYLDAVLSAR